MAGAERAAAQGQQKIGRALEDGAHRRPVWEKVGQDNQLGRVFPRRHTPADADGLTLIEPALADQGARDLMSVAVPAMPSAVAATAALNPPVQRKHDIFGWGRGYGEIGSASCRSGCRGAALQTTRSASRLAIR